MAATTSPSSACTSTTGSRSSRCSTPAWSTRRSRCSKSNGHLYEQDGARWFRSTAFGDEKDRVVQRENGLYTYFASDIAYHANKFERGFDRIIDIWGADHHGYIRA
jgi:hypothetical protein